MLWARSFLCVVGSDTLASRGLKRLRRVQVRYSSAAEVTIKELTLLAQEARAPMSNLEVVTATTVQTPPYPMFNCSGDGFFGVSEGVGQLHTD